jgi:transketolase
MNKINISDLENIATRIRVKLIEISHKTHVPHLASSLSCVEIMVIAYWAVMDINPKDPFAPCRDRFILSKGHAASALFTILSERGFFPDNYLDTMAKEGNPLEGHPAWKCVPGVEASTGSLGHGLSLGLGMSLAGRIQNNQYRIFVLLGDGECNEGTIWEAAMFASSHNLENVTAIIDFNKWQATGRSCEVMAIEPLQEKWRSFGWSAYEIDGHDLNSLVEVLSNVPDGSNRPVAIVAHTIKGKGISFMEDNNNWHYRIPDKGEVLKAKMELGQL